MNIVQFARKYPSVIELLDKYWDRESFEYPWKTIKDDACADLDRLIYELGIKINFPVQDAEFQPDELDKDLRLALKYKELAVT